MHQYHPGHWTFTSYPGQAGDFLQQIDIIYNADYVLKKWMSNMWKWAIGVLTSKGGTVRIMILQRGNVTYVNEKIIWEGWKSLGRRCVGQGGDSQIYEGDKGVWGCQPAGHQERKIFAKMQDSEELKRKKGSQPTKKMT